MGTVKDILEIETEMEAVSNLMHKLRDESVALRSKYKKIENKTFIVFLNNLQDLDDLPEGWPVFRDLNEAIGINAFEISDIKCRIL